MVRKISGICFFIACLFARSALAEEMPHKQMRAQDFNKPFSLVGSVTLEDGTSISIKKAVLTYKNQSSALLFGEQNNMPFVLSIQPNDAKYKVTLFGDGHYGSPSNLGDSFSVSGKCSNKIIAEIESDPRKNSKNNAVATFDATTPMKCTMMTEKGDMITVDVSAGS